MVKFQTVIYDMQYIITFFEGIISFISPCMLPMLPIYVSYFSGGENKSAKTFLKALAFVAGFTAVFSLLGLFAGSIGALLDRYHEAVETVSGIIIILLGLDFLGVIRIPFLKGFHASTKVTGVFSAFVFGVIFSISHAPCMSAFLGTALVTASASGAALKGMLLLLSYSLGLGIPFLISAMLIKRLNAAFEAIKNNYNVINIICGILLIILGVLMATGVLHKLMHLVH